MEDTVGLSRLQVPDEFTMIERCGGRHDAVDALGIDCTRTG